MIKIRNKRIALLLVLAMLASLFVGVGVASADTTNFVNVSSSWTFVQADTDQIAGDITITPDDAYTAATLTTTGVVITLKTDGVNFSGTNSNEFAILGGVSLPATYSGASDLKLDVDDTVTGAITADVRVYGKNGSAYVFDETETQTIAKVDAGTTVVAVGAKKSVSAGDAQEGARLTVKEAGPTAFDTNEDVTFSILTAGVTWDGATFITDPGYVYPLNSSYVDQTDKKLVGHITTHSDKAERIAIDPYFTVNPTVPVGTEIKVKVSGDSITSATEVVAVVGSGDVAVKVTDGAVDTLYRGEFTTFDDVTVKLNPGGSLKSNWESGDWFSITLPAGVKFQNTDAASISGDVDNAINVEGLYDSDSTVWFTVSKDSDETIKLSDFALVADANAVPGDLNVTFKGDVVGTAKIGTIASAFTVTSTPFALTSGMTDVAAPDIVIKETADGALMATGDSYDNKDGDAQYIGQMDIVLPAGVTFVGTPAIDVTDGDLSIDSSSVGYDADFRTLSFDVTDTSSNASTITISGLEYSVLSQPGYGDLKALVGQDYNVASDKALESAVIGAVSVNPTAVYVIGASTFTVNGAVQSVVAPSYVKNNRTYLAIRDIATGLGIDPMNVLWDEAGQKVTMIKGDKIVQVAIGSTTMYVNGTAIAMDVAPEMGPSFRTMLPAAYIAQAFGATASWDGLTSTVTIK